MDIETLSPSMLRPANADFGVRKEQSPEEMRRIAQDFEASFLSQMFKPMFEGLKSDGPFGGGAGEEMWRGFLVDEMAKQTAKSGGIGLANTVMSHMLKAQEGLV